MFWVKGGRGKQKNPHFPDLRSFQVTFKTQPKVQPLCTAPTAPTVLIYTNICPKIPQGKFCQYFGSARKLLIASQYQKKTCQIIINVIKCWVPAYPGHHPYQYLSQLGCGGGCSELQLVRINITLLPLMELQKFPAAVTSLQCFTVLKRSFDFKTFYSGRRNPAAMGRLPLKSARQQAGFPLTWKFKVWHWCFLYLGQSNTFPVVCLCQDSIQSK